MSATRAVIARRLLESKQSIPHYRLAIEVDVNALMARKRELAAQSRVTINDLIVRACALALVKHPALNATLEGDGSCVGPTRISRWPSRPMMG